MNTIIPKDTTNRPRNRKSNIFLYRSKKSLIFFGLRTIIYIDNFFKAKLVNKGEKARFNRKYAKKNK